MRVREQNGAVLLYLLTHRRCASGHALKAEDKVRPRVTARGGHSDRATQD